MTGLSGSGKSTTAQALADQAGAIRLRSDAVRKHLAGVPLYEKAPDSVYTSEMSDRTYTRLITLGVQLASQGYRVILDAKFDRSAKRQEAIATAQSQAIRVTFVHCTAPADVLKARVTQRSSNIADRDIADATADILAKQSMEAFLKNAAVVTLDTTQDPAALKKQLAGIFSELIE